MLEERSVFCCSFEREHHSFIRSSSSQKKSEIKRKNHVRRCSLLRESRRPDDANEFRADETRERETGESVEKPNRREGTFFRFSTMMMMMMLACVLVVFFFCFFFLPFVVALFGCVLLCVLGGKRLIFPSSSSKRGERKNAEEEEEGEVRRSRARKKDEENRVACTLSRARSQNSFARVRRDPSGFSVFRKGDWDERQRINFVHRRDLSSSCLVSSKSLPGRTKEEEKRALIYAKENESTTKTHETPSFFLEPKQTTDRHRDHGAGCSLHRLPGSVPRGAKRRRASRGGRTVFGRRRVGGYFELLFLLVGVGRLGSIWLVNFVQMCVNIMSKQKQREKREKEREERA